MGVEVSRTLFFLGLLPLTSFVWCGRATPVSLLLQKSPGRSRRKSLCSSAHTHLQPSLSSRLSLGSSLLHSWHSEMPVVSLSWGYSRLCKEFSGSSAPPTPNNKLGFVGWGKENVITVNTILSTRLGTSITLLLPSLWRGLGRGVRVGLMVSIIGLALPTSKPWGKVSVPLDTEIVPVAFI